MADRDSTLLAPAAPTTSRYPLMGVELLSIHKTKVLDSFFIEHPSGTVHGNSANDLFDPPIQITVLGVDKDTVYLGIYAHPSLVLTKANKPNACWRQSWNHFADNLSPNSDSNPGLSRRLLREPKRTSTPPDTSFDDTSLNGTEDNVQDELAALNEAHYLYYQMIDALFDSEEARLSMDWSLAKAGLSQWQDWLLKREQRVRHLLDTKRSNKPKRVEGEP